MMNKLSFTMVLGVASFGFLVLLLLASHLCSGFDLLVV